MKFIKMDELKPGMRLARPIYSKKGVLLYERASVIRDSQAIQNIRGFGLLGLFILEPAEPVPPFSEEDMEFERFQTMMSFEITEELNHIRRTKKTERLSFIVASIVKSYGNETHKVNFFQSLRSMEDYIYKHSLNTAILAAIITHQMNVPLAVQNVAVTAALVHDIGKLDVPQELMYKSEHTDEEQLAIHTYERAGFDLLKEVFISEPGIARACQHSEQNLRLMERGDASILDKMQPAARVLQVAGVFDKCTAVRMEETPMSELQVFRMMLGEPEYYDENVVRALLNSVTILTPGTSVELTNGKKALVLSQNDDLMHPIVLCFDDNQIINLSDRHTYRDLDVADIMKTMDNRHVMDKDMLKSLGYAAD